MENKIYLSGLKKLVNVTQLIKDRAEVEQAKAAAIIIVFLSSSLPTSTHPKISLAD